MKDVFSKPEFMEAARDKVLLVEIDVPYPGKENRAKDMALAARNTRISKEYGIDGFPYSVLLDPSGKEIARFDPTQYPNPDSMLAHLDKLLK
jgi:thioredoxin-related protein